MIKNKILNRKGFTLIEMLMVISLLSIFVLIALPRLISLPQTAREKVDSANAVTIFKDVQAGVMIGNIDITTSTRTDITKVVTDSGVNIPVPQSTTSLYVVYATKEDDDLYMIEISLDNVVLYSGTAQDVLSD